MNGIFDMHLGQFCASLGPGVPFLAGSAQAAVTVQFCIQWVFGCARSVSSSEEEGRTLVGVYGAPVGLVHTKKDHEK